MQTWGSHYWPLFLIISGLWVLLGFGIPELMALFTQVSTHTDNTLSNYTQQELGVSAQITRHTLAWTVSLLAWVTITTILTWHIWFRLGGG
jgi:hypothetical protein